MLVGNASAFASQLKGVGFGTFETVPLGDLDLTAANFKRGTIKAEPLEAGGSGGPGWPRGSSLAGAGLVQAVAYHQAPLASRPSQDQRPEDLEKATKLLDRAIAAKGGLDVLRGVKSIIAKQTLKSAAAAGPAELDTTTYIRYPDRLRIETQVPSGANIQGFDGAQAWMKDQRGVREQPESVAREARINLRRDIVPLLLAAKDGRLIPRILPDVRDAVVADQLLELSAPDFNPLVLYIDARTGLIDKLTFIADAPSRPLVEERFSDYRAVDGMQIAFQATRVIGRQTVERRITEVKVNVDLDPALFKRPAS